MQGTGAVGANDDLTDGKSYELIQPSGILTSTTSDYVDIDNPRPSSGVVIENPQLEHYEMSESLNMYHTMSDSSLRKAIAFSYEEPVPTPRVRSVTCA